MSLSGCRTLVAIRDELTALLARDAERSRAVQGKPQIEEGRTLCRLQWPGKGAFWFTASQARVVKVLLDAYFHSRTVEVDQVTLIRESGERVSRLAELFVGSGAWNVLIVPGERAGYYRLVELPDVPPAG